MIFTPYKDELTIINRIQKIRNTDYVLLRLTSTMIGKNNLDANEYFREMLLNHNIVNYEMLENGGSNGTDFSSILILPNSVQSVKLKFYRVNNARGDRRFSIETIKRKIPVIMRERQAGVSSISSLRKSAYYMCKVSLAILIERLR